jgi:hypothetical protein
MQFEAPCVDSVQAVKLPFLAKNWVWMWGGNCEVGAEALAKQSRWLQQTMLLP